MGDKHINERIYQDVASELGCSYKEVKHVMGHVGDTIRETIVTDNPSVSVKLDFIGNIFSDKERRKIITIRREAKDGRLTENS